MHVNIIFAFRVLSYCCY